MDHMLLYESELTWFLMGNCNTMEHDDYTVSHGLDALPWSPASCGLHAHIGTKVYQDAQEECNP